MGGGTPSLIPTNDIDRILKLLSNYINIENITEITMEEGRKDLETAQSYYFRYTPILLGAVLGGISLGPVGMLLNVKFGSMFTLGGGVLGGYGGYKIQK